MQRIPPELTNNARALRINPTDAERRLWSRLRTIRPRFTRQLVIDRFIVDFACRTPRLAVELDGGQHSARIDADQTRTAYLQADGWRVIRFWNNDVLANTDGVMQVILVEIAARGATHPCPSLSRRGEQKEQDS